MGNEKTIDLEEKPLVNIEMVEIITEESTPRIMRFDTASEGTYTPVISEGTETILRIKNRISAINRTEDIQYGCDIGLKDVVFLPEVLEVIDGGTLKTETTGESPNQVTKVTGYDAPKSGAPVKRTKFTTNIYTAEKDTEGETLGYTKFSFPGCKGKPVNFAFKDGEFMTPEYTISSRPPKNTAPFSLEFIDQLPQ